MRSRYPFLVASAVLIMTCGCVETYHQKELGNLPTPQGQYCGSFIYDSWEYHGSDQQFHYFTYTYNRSNVLVTKAIRIPKNEITLVNLPETAPNKKKIATVRPAFDSREGIVGFEKTAGIAEQMEKK